jgi:predicted aspartyl protease
MVTTKKFWIVGLIVFSGALNAHTAESRTALPVKLCGGYTVMVQGSMGNARSLNFIIDTGALPTVVDVRTARRLRLSGKREALTVFSRQVGADRVTLPDLRIGPVHTTGVEALVADLSFAEKSLGIRIDAIVGLDVLGQQSFSIDYRAKQLLFGQSRVPDWVATFQPGLTQVVVELQIDARPVRLLVDTGAKYFILFAAEDRKQWGQGAGGFGEPSGQLPSETITTFGGGVHLQPVRLNHVRLGATDLPDQVAYLTPAPSGAELGFDGVLGVAALNVQRIDFDFEHGRVGWLR